MIKRLVHIERIERPGEKKQIQIKLPLNVKRILEVKTTAVPKVATRKTVFQPEVGWLWLRLSECRDIFYTEIIKLPLPVHNQTIMGHHPVDDFGHGTYWTQGKKEAFFSITATPDTHLLEGFYVDRSTANRQVFLPQLPRPVSPVTFYELRIYLTIEI